jgi:hypothetical protein
MPVEVGNYIIEKLANILPSIRAACNNTKRKWCMFLGQKSWEYKGKMKSQCENFKSFSKFNMETIIMILCIVANLEVDYH